MDYILTQDGRQLEIPSVSDETQSDTMKSPTQMADGSKNYDSNYGAKAIMTKTTVAKEESERKYQELYGYLKGRAGRKETIYLERLGTTIEGYIRILSAESKFEGIYGVRKELKIRIEES